MSNDCLNRIEITASKEVIDTMLFDPDFMFSGYPWQYEWKIEQRGDQTLLIVDVVTEHSPPIEHCRKWDNCSVVAWYFSPFMEHAGKFENNQLTEIDDLSSLCPQSDLYKELDSIFDLTDWLD